MRHIIPGLALLTLCAGAAGGCHIDGPQKDNPNQDPETPTAQSVESGYTRMLSEQIVFKGGEGYIRTIPWSSDPTYTGAGGYIYSEATAFRELPSSWYRNLPTHPMVSGYTAFAVGESLHEHIWLGPNGYKRTRNAITGEPGDWVYDRHATQLDSSCGEVTAYAISRHESQLVESVWCGTVGLARYLSTDMNEAAGSYEITHYGDWFRLTPADLPFPSGTATGAPVVQLQGAVVKMNGAIAQQWCHDRVVSVYGYLRQAWWHGDDNGYYRDVPLDSASLPLWQCPGATSHMTLADLEGITPEFGPGSVNAASNHRLYDLPAQDAVGHHRYELRATRYNILDFTVGVDDHHIGMEIVHLVNGRRVWSKRLFNHGLTINSNHYTVLAAHDLSVNDPQFDITEARKLAYMKQCVDYIPNGYCDSACGNDGYTLPPLAISDGISGSDSRPNLFTPKDHFDHEIHLSPTLIPIPGPEGTKAYDVPRYGHNSNNDAEAEYRHFLRCNWDDYQTGAAAYQQIADEVCGQQCDGYAAAPGSDTSNNIARMTMESCGHCETLLSDADDDMATRANIFVPANYYNTLYRMNPCAGNHREGQFDASCRRVFGM